MISAGAITDSHQWQTGGAIPGEDGSLLWGVQGHRAAMGQPEP